MVQVKPTLDVRNPKDREGFFLELYEETFPSVAKFVSRRGGSFQDARDIFHDSLVIFFEKMVGEKLAVSGSHEFYLIGIAKHLWIRKYKEESKKVGLTDVEQAINLPEDYFEASDNKLTSFLELVGKKCLNLLQAFYYESLPLQQIKEAFGFSNIHSVSVQKYKCIEKLRNIIQEKAMGYEDFK